MQDITSTRSLFFYLYTIWLGHLLGCRVMMYGCGIGPISKPFNRRIAAKVIDCCIRSLSLRASEPREEVKRLGLTWPEIIVAADPALNLSPSPKAC